jgi:hypothetical protein|tara:strand:- start:743 stop:967 length:225 start_codon:yes stop_codon:yes gene_type:complete
MKEYKDKDINNMILFLRVNRFAEFQYIDNITADDDDDGGDLRFYDYMSDTHCTRDDVVKLAKENKWKPDWQKGE